MKKFFLMIFGLFFYSLSILSQNHVPYNTKGVGHSSDKEEKCINIYRRTRPRSIRRLVERRCTVTSKTSVDLQAENDALKENILNMQEGLKELFSEMEARLTEVEDSSQHNRHVLELSMLLRESFWNYGQIHNIDIPETYYDTHEDDGSTNPIEEEDIPNHFVEQQDSNPETIFLAKVINDYSGNHPFYEMLLEIDENDVLSKIHFDSYDEETEEFVGRKSFNIRAFSEELSMDAKVAGFIKVSPFKLSPINFDPENGGEFELKYIHNFFTKNYKGIQLAIVRQNGSWAMTDQEGREITLLNARMKTSKWVFGKPIGILDILPVFPEEN